MMTVEEQARYRHLTSRRYLLARAGVPGHCRLFTWEASPAPATKVAEFREALAAGRSVLLRGGVGTGKTGLAVCALLELLRVGRDASFVDWSEWLRHLRDCYRGEGEPTAPILDRMFGRRAPAVMVIDDLGAEGSFTDAVKADARLVVHKRQLHELQTIATTNLDAEGLRDAYDVRTVDRLRDYKHVVLDGESVRGRKS